MKTRSYDSMQADPGVLRAELLRRVRLLIWAANSLKDAAEQAVRSAAALESHLGSRKSVGDASVPYMIAEAAQSYSRNANLTEALMNLTWQLEEHEGAGQLRDDQK